MSKVNMYIDDRFHFLSFEMVTETQVMCQVLKYTYVYMYTCYIFQMGKWNFIWNAECGNVKKI